LYNFLTNRQSAGNGEAVKTGENQLQPLSKLSAAIKEERERVKCVSISPCCSFHVVRGAVSAAAEEAAMPLRFEFSKRKTGKEQEQEAKEEAKGKQEKTPAKVVQAKSRSRLM